MTVAAAGAAAQPPRCCAADAPVPYLQRTRRYYQALGYGRPYDWARVDKVPFQRLRRPLSRCRVALVTTAAPFKPGAGDQGPGAPYNAAAKFYDVYSGDTATDPDLRIAHVAIDRQHTTAHDPASYFPLVALRRVAAAGRIGGLTPRFHGLPTQRSQRVTLEVDAPQIVARCLEDAADAVLLVANCPVCHQSLGLAAHQLEAAGIATVLMGCALDIVEHLGVPRLLFSDFPLGNAAGRPDDPASQQRTLELALQLLETADAARSTLVSPLRWTGPVDWKLDYANVDRLTPEQLARLRAEFDLGKAQASALRTQVAPARLTR